MSLCSSGDFCRGTEVALVASVDVYSFSIFYFEFCGLFLFLDHCVEGSYLNFVLTCKVGDTAVTYFTFFFPFLKEVKLFVSIGIKFGSRYRYNMVQNMVGLDDIEVSLHKPLHKKERRK